jgi:hypothetical protein
MGAFVRTVADDQFGVDAKLPSTLSALFFKPGQLTSEYMNGRIARYIPPFRLYLFASVLFFVLLSFLSRQSDWAEVAAEEMKTEAGTDTITQQRDSSARGLNVGVTIGGKQWLEDVRMNTGWRWLDQRMSANLQALGELPPNVALRRVTDAIIEELPKVMFVLLPVFALLLKLIYIRRRRYYLEHFIFALHLHAFAFTLFAFVLVFRADWLMSIVSVVIMLYTLLAMKRVYAQGYFRTIAKWLVLGAAYSVLLGIGLGVALVWALAGTSAT